MMIADQLCISTVRVDIRDVLAPDGSEIRVLSRCGGASMAHGTLPPGRTSLAIRHRTVEEIWFVLSGSAEMWRRLGDRESVEVIVAGQSLTIPVGCEFQFRTVGDGPFTFIMCTLPPWPGADEAIMVSGMWEAENDIV
jgi:mannose-6-phosphate isomerase-like protein (cupin superfamily)